MSDGSLSPYTVRLSRFLFSLIRLKAAISITILHVVKSGQKRDRARRAKDSHEVLVD